MLFRSIPDLASWNITILATDINPRFLKKAAEAVYGSWSFREAPQSLKERYFHEKRSGSFELFPHIKAMVTFAYLNLAEDTYPSLLNNTNAMDVILCRNVLMYFAPDRLKQAARNLRLSLLERGWLLVSPTEASHVLDSEFETVHFPGATLYRNGKKAKPPVFAQAAEREESFSQALDLFPLFTGERISLEESADVSSTSEVEGAEAGTVRPDLYAVAMELYRQGRYAEAADSVLPNLSANPKDFQAMALLARSYANLGRLAEALELSEKAVAFNKLDAGLHYLRAMILQELSFADATVESLKRALYLDQNSVLCYFALGNLARRRGQFKESAKYFDNALSLLNSYGRDEILPESEGITAGRLIEVIQSTHNK